MMDSEIKQNSKSIGMIIHETEIEFSSTGNLRIKSSSNKFKTIFRPDFKFEDMGVGGLDK